MKIKNIIGFTLASALLFGGLTALTINDQKEIKVEEAEAAVHTTNYDEYTYNGDYYDGIVGTGDDLRSQLTTLIYPKGWYTYGGSGADHLSSILQKADEDPENSSNMIYFYTRNSVTKNAASSWNREHCWPQSDSNDCWGTGSAGADLLHIRPTYNTTNSTRGNDKYGDASSYENRVYEGMVYGKKGGGYFEPLDCVKGDAARICMYVWVAYYTHYGSKHPALTKVFSDFNTMITWHVNDKPDVLEGNRNDFCETSKQKNRNPFVDHPEYAWQIFGDKLSSDVLAAAKAAYPATPQATVDVTGVSVNPTSLTLEAGKTGTITATVAPNNATNKKVTWTSSNTAVATVSNGTVTAVAEGTATITVKTNDGNFEATCAVTVTPKTTPVTYTVTFDSAGGSSVASKTVESGSTVNKPADPTRQGYTFAGWYLNDQPYNFSTPVTGNITLVAHWTENSGGQETTTYTVTFDSNGGSAVASQTVNAGSTVSKPANPTRKGYTFDGWYLNDVAYNFSTPVNSNITLVAHWTQNGGGEGGGDTPTPTTAKLTSLEVTAPNKVQYKVGEQLDLTGFKVMAKYDDNSSKDVTDKVTLDAVNMSKAGSKFVIVNYSEGSVSVKGYFEIKVVEGSASGAGCHGSIIASSALISLTSLMGLGLLLLKKKK